MLYYRWKPYLYWGMREEVHEISQWLEFSHREMLAKIAFFERLNVFMNILKIIAGIMLLCDITGNINAIYRFGLLHI